MQTDWQRTSPLGGLYFLLRNVRGLVNLWPAIPAVIALEEWRGVILWVGVPVVLVWLVTVSFLHWWYFRFQYDDRGIQLRSGLLHRRRLTLEFDRVQEINLEQAVYFRPFQLWSLGLESAGSKGEEVHIPGVRRALADDVRGRFLRYKRGTPTAEAVKTEQAEAKPDYTLTLTPGELVRFGLMHNTLIYLAPIIGVLLSQSSGLTDVMRQWLESRPWVQWLAVVLKSSDWFFVAGLVAAILVLGLAVLYVLSILLAMARYWNYTLTVEGDRLHFQAGLFNRVSRGFKQHKLQCVVVRQGVLARCLNRYTLKLQQANDHGGNTDSAFIVPVVDAPTLQRIQALLDVEPPNWQRTMPVRMVWSVALYGTLCGVALGTAAWSTSALPVGWALLVYPVFAALAWGRWRRRRYSAGEQWVGFQSGLIGYQQVFMPNIKVQKLELSQGPVLRRHDAAELKVWSGARSESVGFVSRSRLAEIRDALLGQVGRHRGRWI
ncbi:PH domain-containing protein [Saccharospirillum salsuginis]|uniref:YdbS-like PH domain-containing protein n=1 Tax=Saccharospirillum salsuginis TaxID=418750 RepID=A0A918KR48_9GAMM|nr:PH domain-containing protein [Saccharospirillum salsuginis]GGX72495.1 hypothetical protein GCM10007392_44950 [Saccharospirillum salsuginis]